MKSFPEGPGENPPWRGTLITTSLIRQILSCREVVMKSKNNKRQFSALLSTFDYGKRTIVDSQNDGLYGHKEADVTVMLYVLQSASHGHKVIRALSNNTYIFVSLVYWEYKASIS